MEIRYDSVEQQSKEGSAYLIALFLALALFTSKSSAQSESASANLAAITEELLVAYDDHTDDLPLIAKHADYALLAWAAYGNETAVKLAESRGWTDAGSFQLETSIVTGDVAARLFERTVEEKVLAFRGTTANLGDWVTNISGTLSGYESSPYYSQVREALQLARRFSEERDNIVFVGHSLGGRLAQIAALETGTSAVVFDRAPFGQVELKKWPALAVSEPEQIVRFRGVRDPLTEANPFARDDTAVRNIVGDLGFDDYTYGHQMDLIALAMQDVRIAWESGWLSGEKDGRSMIISKMEEIKSSYPRTDALDGCAIPYGPLSRKDVTALLYGSSLTRRRGPRVRRTSDVSFSTPAITTTNHEETDACVADGGGCFLAYVCENSEADVALVSTGYSTTGPRLIYNIEKQPIPDWITETRRGLLFQEGTTSVATEIPDCRVSIPSDLDADRATWSGQCANGKPDGIGRLSLYKGVELIDYIDVNPSHHLMFESGDLYWEIDLREYEFTMENCSLRSNRRPSTTISSKTSRPSSAVANFTVAKKLLEAGIEFGSAVCGNRPPALKGAGSRVVFPNKTVAAVFADADEFGAIAREKIASYAINDKRAEVRRLNQERVQKEREEMQEKFRVASIKIKREREIAAIRDWEASFGSSVPIENIADLLKYKPAKTIALLSEGREIVLKVQSVNFANGKLLIDGRHYYTEIYVGVADEAKASLGLEANEDSRFSWAQWFDMINSASKDKYVAITCQVEAADSDDIDVNSSYIIDARLTRYDDPGFGAPAARFDCDIEGRAE